VRPSIEVIDRESNLRARGPTDWIRTVFIVLAHGAGAPAEKTPTLWQVLRGARPVEVWLNNWSNQGWAEPPVTVERAQRMARALRFFGSLEEISIQNAYEEGMALLMGSAPNRIDEVFLLPRSHHRRHHPRARGFPQLEELAINSSNFTGKNFPYLPHLQTVDFAFSPISIEGLRAITESPSSWASIS
jgi:hypothetical protein